jgi:hypothetical protein
MLAGIAYQLLDLWSQRGDVQVRPLSGAQQEIALIEPATNTEEWERIVSAAQQLERSWPKLFPEQPALTVSLAHAFPRLTADVPELALSFSSSPEQQLVIRWYKISGEHSTSSWIDKLRQRGRAPLAVLGGATSGRAVRLAQELDEALHAKWPGAAPALLISTATAEFDPGSARRRRAEVSGRAKGGPDADAPRKLIDIYAGRSFRYSFTNPLMVEAVLHFVQQHPDVWVHKGSAATCCAPAVSAGDPWTALAVLHAAGHFQPYSLHTLHWDDDSYSRDLADAFREEFARREPHGRVYDEGTLPYSVGDFYHPTPPEQGVVGTLLANRSPFPPHTLLVLPASPPRMRRVLGNLRSRAPLDVRNLLVVNGDSLSFHTVYRDRDYAWNIQDLPFSLLFFAHRNPIDFEAGFAWEASVRDGRSTSGTHDLLLFRDILESVLHAAFADGRLLASADVFIDRLRESRWCASAGRVDNALVHSASAEALALFDADGNRQRQTGEHIVWLRPSYSGDQLDLVSTLFVWRAGADATWHKMWAQDVSYNQPRPEAP